MIQGMSVDTARRYIKAIKDIEEIIYNIHAVAYLMSTFSEIEDNEIELKPTVIGYLGKRIADDILRITELLDDDFASRAEVELELNEIKDNE